MTCDKKWASEKLLIEKKKTLLEWEKRTEFGYQNPVTTAVSMPTHSFVFDVVMKTRGV